jgi:hypothetical protein
MFMNDSGFLRLYFLSAPNTAKIYTGCTESSSTPHWDTLVYFEKSKTKAKVHKCWFGSKK